MPDIRITVGRVEVSPNSGSTIPGETKFNVDLRHPQASKLNFIESQIMGICQKLGKDRSVAVEVDRILEIPPVVFNESCVNDIEAAAVGLKVPYRRMISGALHDACPISSIVPTAMIFVPCQDGISHNEAENAEPEDLERGCNVLLHAILSRANPSM